MPNVKRKARVMEKLLKRRQEAVLQRKEANLEFKKQQEKRRKRNPITQENTQRETLENMMPVDIDTMFTDTMFTGKSGDHLTREQAIEKIKHNLEILKVLEKEFEKEELERAKNNSEMDQAGITDLQEKVAEATKKLQAVSGFRPVV